MTERQARGLAALLADSLCAGRPDPERFVRYAQNPCGLSASEIQEIEHHLEHTPGCRAQLVLLRRALARRIDPPPSR